MSNQTCAVCKRPLPCLCVGRMVEQMLSGALGRDMRDREDADREAVALAIAHEVNGGETERGKAIRAHLITMGWRPPS